MFPDRDETPQFHTPLMTIWFVVFNVLGWVFIQGMGAEPALPSAAQGLLSLGSEEGAVAFRAQVGSFLAGAVLVVLFRNRELVERHRLARLEPR